MPFFSHRRPSILGLDISSTAVKLIELSRSGVRYRVESYALEPLSPSSMADKNIADIHAVGDTIKRAVKRSGTHAKHAALAVAGSAAITRIITMPANLTVEELSSQIELEADQYIPYPLDEVNFDFEVIGPSEKNPQSIDVLLAATRSENVDTRVAAAEVAGLTAKVVDVEAFAMENAFGLIAQDLPKQGKDMTVAVLDIGATTTTLNVLHGGKNIYTRDHVFGGRQLTEEIMRRYGLSYEEAGMAKRQGGLPANYGPEVLEPFKEAMAQQVGRSLQFFFSSSRHNSVDHVLLAGGSAALPGIDDLVEQQVNTPVSIANPFAHMALSSRVKPQALSGNAAALMVACGLALRSFH